MDGGSSGGDDDYDDDVGLLLALQDSEKDQNDVEEKHLKASSIVAGFAEGDIGEKTEKAALCETKDKGASPEILNNIANTATSQASLTVEKNIAISSNPAPAENDRQRRIRQLKEQLELKRLEMELKRLEQEEQEQEQKQERLPSKEKPIPAVRHSREMRDRVRCGNDDLVVKKRPKLSDMPPVETERRGTEDKSTIMKSHARPISPEKKEATVEFKHLSSTVVELHDETTKVLPDKDFLETYSRLRLS